MEQALVLLQLAAGTGATAAGADLGGRSSSIPVAAAEADAHWSDPQDSHMELDQDAASAGAIRDCAVGSCADASQGIDMLETEANRDARSHLDEVEQDDSLMYSMTSAAVWGLLREMLER